MKPTLLVMNGLLLLGSAFAWAAADDPDVPKLSEYAWGFPIIVERDASFYSIELPLEVNQSVSDPALRDAGVYNADGDPVARVFQKTSDEVEEVEHLTRLPAIPLRGKTEHSGEEVKLLFEREGDKTRVELDSAGSSVPENDEKLSAYIVDTRQLKHSVEALDFTWKPIDTGFIGRIKVDGSNNLEDWTEIGSGAVADLRENDAGVLQRRVKLRKSSHDFLRIRWDDLPDQWRLSGVEGLYSTGVTTRTRNSTILEAGSEDAQDDGRIFDLGGAPYVDRLRLVLTRPNTVVSANIYYWSVDRQRWIQAASGPHHHVGRGDNIVMSSAVPINPVRASRFKVVLTRGQPRTPLQLEVGWRPDSLIFLAQGPGPFTLAAGRAAAAADDYPQHRIYGDRSIVDLATASGRAIDGLLGPRYPLGGPTELRPDGSLNWRRLSLWIGLILGVTFVGFMAVKVSRDLKAD